jgi:phosphoribosylamine--glycine ligase
MIDAHGAPRVVEFNCRFGDPEAQPVMMRLQTDLVELCEAALAGKLHECTIDFDSRAAVGVVLAAGGYPDAYAKGKVIHGLDTPAPMHTRLFHAGTREEKGQVVTNGGRVMCATALGDTVSSAQKAAYRLVDNIHWDNMYCRRDIGWRAIAREEGQAS